ncbi:MAG TPA: DUF502 domain-containing protein [Methylophilaceae bacterium]|nr:DUF502 domain-containing protein [Methylophilaceae bacterium]
MFRYINKNILTGLITMLPLLLTIYLVYWFVVGTEAFLGEIMRAALPDDLYRPGMGVAVGLVAAFIVGLLMHTLLVRRLFYHGERLVSRVPLIKSVYLSTRDILEYFSAEKREEFEQVVSVTLGNMQVVGLVTQTDMEKMPKDFRQEDSLLVYVPMSYGIGGFAVLVPRSATRPLDMSMEDAMRFTLTAGVTGSKSLEIEEEMEAALTK